MLANGESEVAVAHATLTRRQGGWASATPHMLLARISHAATCRYSLSGGVRPARERRFMRVAMLLTTWALSAVIGVAAAVAAATSAGADSRIKDIADIEGVRDNQLVGYGLVLGLNGTGDQVRGAPQTRQSLASLLERFGVNTRDADIIPQNVAAVVVTANLPAFAMAGARMDVTVSTTGDATDLSGGVLLATPLIGADGKVYAVAQGAVAANGFAADGDAASIVRNVPTTGRIANGAIVERELAHDLGGQTRVRLALRNPDFATAGAMASAINRYLGLPAARALNPGVVAVERPASYGGDMVALLTELEQLRVRPDQPARVVIDEAAGVVVMGADVQVSTVAIAQGALTISVSEAPVASQPPPFAEGGETVVLPRTEVAVEEPVGGLAVLDGGAPLADLVDGLNALGVSPRDLITIIQALKAAGALQAEIEVI